jgi:glutamyl-tRNA reductase
VSILVVGLSHHTAPVDVRDRVAFPAHVLSEAVSDLSGAPGVRECVIVSTCNRCEVYVVAEEGDLARQTVTGWVCDFHDLARADVEGHLFCLHEAEAVRHLFRVACGLDSMIVGEPQIAGQVKDAHAAALSRGATGVVFNRLFQMATEVSKRARTETEIGEGAVSVPYAAVELAKKIFGNLGGHTALVIGAGEMSELTARHLISGGVRSLRVASRTLERAREMADQVGGHALPFDEAMAGLHEADVIISSTSAPAYVLRRDVVAQAMQRRRNEPMFLIDIAVPRDIEPEAGKLYNVFLYDIDDLQSVVGINLAKREQEALKARDMVEGQVTAFYAWLNSLDVVPTIVSLRGQFEATMAAELERAKLAGFSEEQQKRVAALLRGYTNKLLHGPVTRLKEAAESGDGLMHVHAVQYLFGLNKRSAVSNQPEPIQSSGSEVQSSTLDPGPPTSSSLKAES